MKGFIVIFRASWRGVGLTGKAATILRPHLGGYAYAPENDGK